MIDRAQLVLGAQSCACYVAGQGHRKKWKGRYYKNIGILWNATNRNNVAKCCMMWFR
jgi:hypothetical protein